MTSCVRIASAVLITGGEQTIEIFGPCHGVFVVQDVEGRDIEVGDERLKRIAFMSAPR